MNTNGKEVGIFIGDELIGSLNDEFTDTDSHVTSKLTYEGTFINKYHYSSEEVNADKFQYYMRRGNKMYLRNRYHGTRIAVEGTNIKEVIGEYELKYGQIYTCKFFLS